ncbi:MAG: PPC domain-containing protein [Gemmatimonadota bacterium]
MTDTARSFARSARWASLFLVFAMSACDPLGLSMLFDRPTEGSSVLALLGTDDREIDIGDEAIGSLSSADYFGVNESYLEAWAFEGREGEVVTFDLMSDDFDSRLYIVGPGLDEVLSDDDSGGACHARIRLTVLESGTFHVVASSLSSRTTGRYRLRASENPPAGPSISCGGIDGGALSALPPFGAIRLGEERFGQMSNSEATIENGRPVQRWTIDGRAGDRLTISLESDDYDSYLYFTGPGMAEAETNDDGGEGLDSEMTVTLTMDGTYTIGAAALSSGAMGAYRLSVSAPVDPANLPTAGRQLSLGVPMSGALTDTDARYDGHLVQAWSFRAEAGQRVTIDQMSEDFDSYLRIVGPGLSERTNDDGGDGLNSRLDVTFPETGEYRIIAGSLGGNTGSFTVQVR